jgi:hypothetical protein
MMRPSEQTPLIANQHEAQALGFQRGLAILVLMGVLIFIQGSLLL